MKRATKKDNVLLASILCQLEEALVMTGRTGDDRNINRITLFLFVAGKMNFHAVPILVPVAC
jgi:hypothetical protein